METTLPRWSVRLDARRPASSPGFTDLLALLTHHYRAHVQLVDFLGPYNARQRGGSIYVPPSREQLQAAVRQGAINSYTYQALINRTIDFCEQTKGLRALPTPHPSTIHSIQLPQPAFQVQPDQGDDTIIKLIGIDVPVIVRGLRQAADARFIIVRPKLSKLGTPSAISWEVLFFRQALGYIPEWADTTINPRYAGVL